MTLNDLNKKLALLAEQPGRDNILDFSQSLLEWMNIASNPGNKPQLISPQTLKLKDYLATAPQTVQPQLYRLSADNQNIRVRFAVLKKLKKDYISQLVDNDPGLSSYQSFTKGLTTQSNGTGFIPTQPYFIHFITTPDYDRLILIFNQADQKRIITFRKRLTNTQHNKIIIKWENIGTKSKPEIADLLWKSLDIKEVNKEFYKQIKERFDALLGILSEPKFIRLNDDKIQNIKKQFAVRFLGRYIFCWFLKEKDEILPHSLISSNEIRKFKEAGRSFYHERLLKLFFGTLNTMVSNRNWLSSESAETRSLYEKIPYLNGGLFDDNNTEDQLFNSLEFNINDWLIKFVEILESYDFTIDESSSQYQQVAVDPEMLGRIFENLLASQNEETEKIANQRKAFGAFYTPREIVDYMVDESIKAYLQTQWEEHTITEKSKQLNNPTQSADLFGSKKPQQLKLETQKYQLRSEEKHKIEKAVETLFTVSTDGVNLKKDEKSLLDGFLKKIKVLDPACGSGAFPMGILHKLKELRERLGFYTDPYQLKLDILSNNIYGVDIMPMATEIARLRSWLSLILEADYKPNLPQNNFGVDALPNLDFKFVCANSLIDLGLDAFIADTSKPLLVPFNKKLVDKLKGLENLRKEFFAPALGSTEKEVLKNEYLTERDNVVKEIEQKKDEPILIDIAQKIKNWNPFDDSQPSPFFSPTWMFGIDNGFDVVIGNPPYVEHKKLKHISSLLKDKYDTYSGTADLYVYFYENGIKQLKENGTLVFITSNKFIKTSYGENLRKYFINHCINEIIDFTEVHVFEALVASCIFSISKRNCSSGEIKVAFADDSLINFANLSGFINQHSFALPQKKISKKIWQLETTTNLSLKEKIEKNSVTLSEIETINIYRGVTTGYNPAFIIDEEKRNELITEDKANKSVIKPLLQGRNIRKWIFSNSNCFLIFIPWHFPLMTDSNIIGASKKAEKAFKEQFPSLFKHLNNFKDKLSARNIEETGVRYEWYALQRCAASYYNEFATEKIIWGLTSDQWTFAYDEENNFLPSNGYILTSSEIPIKYLLALLNSRLMEYYFGFIGIMTAGGAFTLKQETVSEFPIKIITNSNPFITRVEKILSLKKAKQDTSILEKEIDVLVYKLYDLSYEEVMIIDKYFWLSNEEYENYKL